MLQYILALMMEMEVKWANENSGACTTGNLCYWAYHNRVATIG